MLLELCWQIMLKKKLIVPYLLKILGQHNSLPYLSFNLNKSIIHVLMCLKQYWMSGKQWRPWSDAMFCGVWFVSTLFALACLSQYLGLLWYLSLFVALLALLSDKHIQSVVKLSHMPAFLHVCLKCWPNSWNLKCLSEAIQMSTCKVCFPAKLSQILTKITAFFIPSHPYTYTCIWLVEEKDIHFNKA